MEHGIITRIHDLNGFHSASGVPIQGIQCKLMWISVGEVDVEAEGRIVEPYCCDSGSAGPAGAIFQSSWIGWTLSPRIGSSAVDADVAYLGMLGFGTNGFETVVEALITS